MTDLSALVDDVLEGLHGKAHKAPEKWVVQDPLTGVVLDDMEVAPDLEDTRTEAESDAGTEHEGEMAAAPAETELTEGQKADLDAATKAKAHFDDYQAMIRKEMKSVVWLAVTDAGMFTRSGKRRAKRKMSKGMPAKLAA